MEFHVNFIAIGVATIASMVIGSLWFGPLFGKQWMALNHFTKEGLRESSKPMWTYFAISALTSLIAAFGLSMYLGKEPSVSFGAFAGFAAAFFWIGTSKYNSANYDGSSKKLWLLNFGYDVVVYTAMGSIIGAIQ